MEIPLARNRVDRFAALMLVLHALVLTGLVALAVVLLDGTAQGVALVGLVGVWLCWSGLYVFTWSRLRGVDFPLALHGYGVFARSQLGELSATWAAVESATVERTWTGRLLRIRLVPTTSPEHAGVSGDVPARMSQLVARHGIRYSLRVLDIAPEELRQAFVVQSGGRIRVG